MAFSVLLFTMVKILTQQMKSLRFEVTFHAVGLYTDKRIHSSQTQQQIVDDGPLLIQLSTMNKELIYLSKFYGILNLKL